MSNYTAKIAIIPNPHSVSVRVTAPESSKPIFETTIYALTRSGAHGQVEFATHYDTWSRHIADAASYGHPAPIDCGIAQRMRGAGGDTRKIIIKIFDESPSDIAIKDVWNRVDTIIVARRTTPNGQIIPTAKPRFVTSAGVIGRGCEVSARVEQAVVVNPAQAWEDTKQQVTHKINVPFDQVGMWVIPHKFDYRQATRVIQIAPVGVV